MKKEGTFWLALPDGRVVVKGEPCITYLKLT